MAQRYFKGPESDPPEALDKQRNNFNVCRGLIRADEFRADLKDLPIPTGMLRLIAKHRGPVGQPEGKTRTHHAHRNGPGNLGGRIWTEQENAAGGAIRKLVAFFDYL